MKIKKRTKRIGDNNRKNQHYYQIIKNSDNKIIKTIKHRVDHSKME